MKKHILILSAIVALAACTKEVQPVAAPSAVTTFTGEALATKITMGDKEGSAYKALWAEGDSLAIVDAASGAQLGVAKLQSGAGANKGVFATTANIADGTSVKLVYGSAAIPATQKQKAAADRNIVTGASSEAVSFAKGGDVPFTLVHTPAIVKVNVSSSAFSAMKLKSVMVYSKGASIADGADYAEVVYDEPASLASAQTAFISTLPVESAKDFYVVATMVDDQKTVTIPVEFKGKTLAAGKVNAVNLENLTLESNSVAWYEPVETRYLADGWAYGEENTVRMVFGAKDELVQKQFSVKARGRFNKVVKPASAKTLVIFDIVGTDNVVRVKGSGEATYAIADDCIVPIGICNVRGSGADAGGMGMVGIYGEDGSLIWTINVWIADVKEVALTNGVVLNKNLGSGYDPETWKTWYVNGVYFQWGRFSWNGWGTAQFSVIDTDVKEIGDVIKYAPFKILNSYGVANPLNKVHNDWYLGANTGTTADRKNDLWGVVGTPGNGNVGTKSIYDPCPKGYMVASRAIIEEVFSTGVKSGESTVETTVANGDARTAYVIKYKDSYWPLAGGFNAGGSAKVSRANTNLNRFGWYWSNSPYKDNNDNAYCSYYDNSKSGDARVAGTNRPRAGSYAIRCMKDADNR